MSKETRGEIMNLYKQAELDIKVKYDIDLLEQMVLAPPADLNIFGLVPNPDLEFMKKMVDETQTTCLFITRFGA